MKSHEMREMAEDELLQHHDGLMDELVNLRIKLAVKQLDNTLSVKQVRREIARAKTVMREKKLGARPGQKLSDKS